MFISKSFIPILKNNPSEAKIKSHQLMLSVDECHTGFERLN